MRSDGFDDAADTVADCNARGLGDKVFVVVVLVKIEQSGFRLQFSHCVLGGKLLL